MLIKDAPFLVCAVSEENKISELRIEREEGSSILGNIYVGVIEKVSRNIKAAFVSFGDGQTGYLPLTQEPFAIYTSGKQKNGSLKPGDEILIQVTRDAMKMKLPALSAKLEFPGRYLVLTTENSKTGYSKKLEKEQSSVLQKWMAEAESAESSEEAIEQNQERHFGFVVRTNAGEASKEDFLRELAYLKKLWHKVVVHGIHRTPRSLLFESEAFYLTAVRDIYTRDLDEIITDLPEVRDKTETYLKDFSPEEMNKLRFYEDKLLPLYKLYSLESVTDEIQKEKIWLNSGGFLVIQPTEAFVSIDVNTGKYTVDKKAEETYRKINLEAAKEAARQIRLRNFSGIILIDFINMENRDHREELIHVMQKLLRRDPIRTSVVDLTPLQIMEITRKKVRRPVAEIFRETC